MVTIQSSIFINAISNNGGEIIAEFYYEFQQVGSLIYFLINLEHSSRIYVQCNLDYPDSLGPNKTVRISYSPDNRGCTVLTIKK